MQLCFATNNQNKLLEVSSLVNSRFRIISLGDIGCLEDIPEIHNTIGENSMAKAEYIYKKYHINCFADDTGLEVDALQGEPGVHSARYAGPGRDSEDNIALLLKRLDNNKNRSARFRCVISLIINGNIRQFEGIAEGSIYTQKKGFEGFGYDPIFIPEGHELSFAEMGNIEKNKISHRAIAVKKLIDFLNSSDF